MKYSIRIPFLGIKKFSSSPDSPLKFQLMLMYHHHHPNATRSLTEEEEKPLQSGACGGENPVALQRTMWWILSLHFGFRAHDECGKLCWGDISLQTDPIQDGREMLVWLNERGTKTCKGKENGHRHPFSPNPYATNTQRCLSIFTSCTEATDLKK